MLLKSNQFRLCLTNISMKRERNLTSFCGEMMDMRWSFEILVNWQILVWFKTMLHEQNRRLSSSWITLQKSLVVVFTEVWAFLKNFSIICRVCKPQYAAISSETPKTFHRKEIWYICFSFFLEMIAS